SAQSTIKARSTGTATTAYFPAGLESNSYLITITTRAYDSFLAVGNASTLVTVQPPAEGASFNVSSYLTAGLTSAGESGDNSATIQVINNVANTLNVLNCTGASPAVCAALNRSPCDYVARTCGACLSTFTGV